MENGRERKGGLRWNERPWSNLSSHVSINTCFLWAISREYICFLWANTVITVNNIFYMRWWCRVLVRKIITLWLTVIWQHCCKLHSMICFFFFKSNASDRKGYWSRFQPLDPDSTLLTLRDCVVHIPAWKKKNYFTPIFCRLGADPIAPSFVPSFLSCFTVPFLFPSSSFLDSSIGTVVSCWWISATVSPMLISPSLITLANQPRIPGLIWWLSGHSTEWNHLASFPSGAVGPHSARPREAHGCVLNL